MNKLKPFTEFERDGEWILLPRDQQWRRELYPEEVFDHPAKMQMNIVGEMVTYLTEMGDKVLDPFGGTGTTALAATMGRKVTLIELEKHYLELLADIKAKWVAEELINYDDFTILAGDSRIILQGIPGDTYDLVLTSPPYANLQVGKVNTEFTGQLAAEKANMRKYGASESNPQNFGRLNQFYFQQEMRKIYKQIVRVLKPGGHYVSVTKDQMRAGQRYMYSMDIIKICRECGLEYTGDWFKWKPPGSMLQSVRRSQGFDVVDDEDIIVFKKP